MHDFKQFPELTNSQMQIYYFESPHKQITESFIGKVVKVTDGDTIRVSCNFRDFNFPIRLARIDAPELGEGGEKSKNWLEKQILGQEIEVIPTKTRVEKWGRLLAEIFHHGMNMAEMSLMFRYSVMFGDKTNKILEKEIWL